MSTAPVLDTVALCRLREQLGDSDILRGFLLRYIALLDQRIERLERALSAEDHDGWTDAVLSLKTSSAQAGAQALAERAAALQEDAAAWASASTSQRSTIEGLTERVGCLRRLAAETAGQLRIVLQQCGTAAIGPS